MQHLTNANREVIIQKYSSGEKIDLLLVQRFDDMMYDFTDRLSDRLMSDGKERGQAVEENACVFPVTDT